MYLKHSTPLYWMKSPLYSRRFRGQTVAIAITACRWVLLLVRRNTSGYSTNYEFLDGLRGAINIADDICVYVRRHKIRRWNRPRPKLGAVLGEVCWSRSTALCEKTSVQISVTFMGHKLCHKGVESDPAKVAAIRKCQFQQTKLQCSASWECIHDKPCRWWSKVSTYLFELNGSNYLVLVDRYSDYSERKPLRNTLASTVIRAMKRNFARIPDECITDNGPQFASRMLAFRSRVRVYQYKIVTLPQPRKWEGRISS